MLITETDKSKTIREYMTIFTNVNINMPRNVKTTTYQHNLFSLNKLSAKFAC